MGKRGGVRPNAGRKPQGKPTTVLSVSLRPDVLKWIQELSTKWGVNRSQSISKAVSIIMEKQPFLRVEPKKREPRKERVKYRQGKPKYDDLREIKRRWLRMEKLYDILQRDEFLDQHFRTYNPESPVFLKALSRIVMPYEEMPQRIIPTVQCPKCNTSIPVDVAKLFNE